MHIEPFEPLEPLGKRNCDDAQLSLSPMDLGEMQNWPDKLSASV